MASKRKEEVFRELCCVARSDWENNKQPDNRIGMNVYLSWIEFWKTPEFKKFSKIQKYNRCSGVDGRSSTHTSGSASHRTVAARMKLSLNREPTADELFRETHIRHLKKKKNLSGLYDEDEENDGDGENAENEENDKNSSGKNIWIDKKSQQTYEMFLKLREQQENCGQPLDNNAAFLEAVGGPDKKKRVYGVGSSQSLFYRPEFIPCTSSPANEENQKLQQELKEMKERFKTIENQLAMIIEATSTRRPQSPLPNSSPSQTDLDVIISN